METTFAPSSNRYYGLSEDEERKIDQGGLDNGWTTALGMFLSPQTLQTMPTTCSKGQSMPDLEIVVDAGNLVSRKYLNSKKVFNQNDTLFVYNTYFL